MYWVDADVGTLQSLTGSSVDRLVPNVQNATSVVVDMAGGKVYWAEQTGTNSGRIRRANLNGTSAQLVRAVISVPRQLALDTANGTLYLTNSRGEVQRMNLNGSDYQPDLIVNLASPRGIAIDAAGGRVYWTEQTVLDGADER
jgi:DNA-binding beta-propeller fold protein YncE